MDRPIEQIEWIALSSIPYDSPGLQPELLAALRANPARIEERIRHNAVLLTFASILGNTLAPGLLNLSSPGSEGQTALVYSLLRAYTIFYWLVYM